MYNINKEIIDIIKEYDNEKYLDYIINNVLSEYENDKGHGLSHIYDVINRAFTLNKNLELELDLKIILTAVFYHDIGRKIDDETHEIISAQIFIDDEKMKKYFSENERTIIKEAIEDHRASLEGEPRNIYGKLLSSADRNYRVDLPLKRTYDYRKKKSPDKNLDQIIKESFDFLKTKFGNDGYASNVYFDDGVYRKYLDDLRMLLDDYDLFRIEYIKVNKIEE